MSFFDRFKRKKELQLQKELLQQLQPSIQISLHEYSLKKAPKESITAPPPQKQLCDVFLCYNSEDKQTVLAIGEKLKARGIVPWIDSERIIGGVTFDDVIQKTVMKSRSTAIFVGSAGFGRYQRYEIRALMAAAMSNKLRVIPVLLPQCSDFPEDAVFLRQHQHVRFSHIDDQDALEDLIKAIRDSMDVRK